MENNRETGSKLLAVIVKAAFALLALGFTLISALNGLEFYKILFGFQTAVLITSVFETARVACLFRFAGSGSLRDWIAIPIYVVVAGVCAFASINSFGAKVARQGYAEEAALKAQVEMIKKSYAAKMEDKLKASNKDIVYAEAMTAQFPESDYWSRRLGQLVTSRDAVKAERDAFLSETPEDLEKWVNAKVALLGLKSEAPSKESEEMRSVTSTLGETWKMSRARAQKLVGVIVTITIELSILLLAFLSAGGRRRGENANVMESNDFITGLNEKHGEKAVRKFFAAAAVHYRKTAKLPPLRRLSPGIRPVARALKNADGKEIALILRGNKG